MRRNLWTLGLYALLSLALFGTPVLGHLGSHIIASDPLDSSQFMWFFGWWPHALLHGLNPFVTHQIFYPDGFNLTWSTSMPGPSLLLAPVTLAFSPIVTWNVIQLISPALSAWTAFLLCRHLTRSTPASLIGGYVFGFSPYMLTHLTGGPYLALVPLLPIMVLLVVRRLEGDLAPRRFVIWMALTFVGQYLISSEVLATSVLFGALALLLYFLFYREQRPAVLDTARLLGLGLVGAVILISPFLAFFFFGHQYPPGAVGFQADLTSFVIPPKLVAFASHPATPVIGTSPEDYLGVPLVVLTLVYLWQRRREREGWLLTLFLLCAFIACLGSELLVHGHKTGVPLPWKLFAQLPVLRYAIPLRLVVFLVLPVAIIVSRWLAASQTLKPGMRAAAWGLALLAVAFIFPKVRSAAWNTQISDPLFFADKTYRHYLTSRDRVLTVPVWGENERWLADAGFPFPITAGYAGNPFPPSFTRYPTYQTLLNGKLTSDYRAQLRRFLLDKRVTAIVVEQGWPGPWPQLFGSLGIRPIQSGGVTLYRWRPAT